jgi:ATPase subunit of ABC transporter with duplicated ATPase domains
MSSSLVHVNNLSVSFEDKELFSSLNLVITSGKRIALIGENGSGKSTLLKMIAKLEVPQRGDITYDKGVSSYYMPQLDTEATVGEITVLDYLISLNENYWEIQQKLEDVFGFVITDFETPLSSFSGGEMMKLNLSNALSQPCDLLLLDEPTNHLDITSLKQLESYLLTNQISGVFISHNSGFISNVCTVIWDIHHEKVEVYNGTLKQYRLHSKQVKENNQNKLSSEKIKLARLQESDKREHEKFVKGAKSARKQFLNGSMDSMQYGNKKSTGPAGAGMKSAKLKELQQSSLEKITSLVVFDQPILLPKLNSDTTQGKRKLVELSGFDLVVQEKLLIQSATMSISYGDRISLNGDNGTGKTSLLKLLLLDTSASKKDGLKLYDYSVAYISQRYEIVDKTKTVLQSITSYAPELSELEARHQLSNFKFFTAQDVSKVAADLSGGELARLAFAMVTCGSIDMLILDEPTNNLDISVSEQIAKALSQFPGTIIVVSHDQEFLEELAIEKNYKIQDKKLQLVH